MIAEAVSGHGLSCALIPMDNYYKLSDLPFEQRMQINHDLPGAFDWPLFRRHIWDLASGVAVEMPLYDYTIHNRTERVCKLDPPDVAVIEGLYTLYDETVRGMADLKVFLECPVGQRRERRLRRDIAERGRERAFTEYMFDNVAEPAFHSLVEPTASHADMVVEAPETVLERLTKTLAAAGH
jgi:uridine kinase